MPIGYIGVLVLLVLASQLLHEAVGFVHVLLDLFGVQHDIGHFLVDGLDGLHEVCGLAHSLGERDVDFGDLQLVLLGSQHFLAGVY
jgi:hypothetical protein